MDQNILVSICCLTYNHEKYIKNALDGFLMQKTSFEFEVIIHDDASTDATALIIREYEKKYPHIIKPIYQTENQYSRKKSILRSFVFPKANGKYIAFCEGDDYWIDEYKLDKQIRYMTQHEDCTFCFTNARLFDLKHPKKVKELIPYACYPKDYFDKSKEIYNVGEVAILNSIPTASIVFPKECISKFPTYFDDPCSAGDIKYRLYCTAMGYAYFINEMTCVYRYNVPGSATTSWKLLNKQKLQMQQKEFIHLYDNVDKYTNYQYTDDFLICKERRYRRLLFSASNIKILKDPIYQRIYRQFVLKDKVRFWVKLILPRKMIVLIGNIKKSFEINF
jgi:glycosyltransferase involved in cell wall biosynthesis